MAIFRRRRRVDVGTYEAPPPTDPAPISRVVEEGALIAASAVRMAVKNAIIIRALRDQAAFDEEVLSEVARYELRTLADQNEADADRVAKKRHDAAGARGRAEHQHDYREKDSDQLVRREDVYFGLAATLRDAADDPDFLTRTVRGARDDAWGEISGVLENRLVTELVDPAAESDYAEQREGRLMQFLAFDLGALVGESGLGEDSAADPRRPLDPAPATSSPRKRSRRKS